MTDQQIISILCFNLGTIRGLLSKYAENISPEDKELILKADKLIENLFYKDIKVQKTT